MNALQDITRRSDPGCARGTGAANANEASLFPYFVCRVGGIPARYVEELRSTMLSNMCSTMIDLELKRATEAVDLEAALYDWVASGVDRNQKHLMLQLKRDIHNGRPTNVEFRGIEFPPSRMALIPRIEEYFASIESYEAMIAEFECVHRAETDRTRRIFRERISHPDFQKGILLSSQSLFSSLARYQSGEGGLLNRRDELTERGLLRYFTRTAMKTTPFGRFCTLVPGRLENGGSWPRVEGSLDKKSKLRLNKNLYGVLLGYLKSRSGVRERFMVELNPTLEISELHARCLSLVNGREVFQRLELNEALQLIHHILTNVSVVRLGELIERLCTDRRLEVTEEEVRQYVDKLLTLGFLRFRVGIREQEADWDIPLRDFLESIDDDSSREIIALLRGLREACDRLANSDVNERIELSSKALSEIESAFRRHGISTKIRMNVAFYEDVSGDGFVVVPDRVLAPFMRGLHTIAALTSRIAWSRSEQASMRHFFDTYYGDQMDSIPLLRFYEDFYREHFKAHLEKQQKKQAGVQNDPSDTYDVANPFKLGVVQDISVAHARITELIRERWAEQPEVETIAITSVELDAIIQGVAPPGDECRSLSLFGQLVHPNDVPEKPTIILPNASCLVGYGKYFSRFLHLLPEVVTETLKEHNQSLSPHRIAEICGDAHFNANLHPPLLDWEISYPTGESGPTENQIVTADLVVGRDPHDKHRLALWQVSSGLRIVPVDLGFLNPRMRPPLFQLLSRFTPACNFSIRIPDSAERRSQRTSTDSNVHTLKAEPSIEKIAYRPRVILDECIIIARRRWQIPSVLCPKRVPKMLQSDYFLEVQRWRNELKIPDEVFVRVQPVPAPSDKGKEKQPALVKGAENQAAEKAPAQGGANLQTKRAKLTSKDLYKPQYIDFCNPLLVELFHHLPSSLERYNLLIEERLPSSNQLFRIGQERYSTEFVLQLNVSEEVQVELSVSDEGAC